MLSVTITRSLQKPTSALEDALTLSKELVHDVKILQHSMKSSLGESETKRRRRIIRRQLSTKHQVMFVLQSYEDQRFSPCKTLKVKNGYVCAPNNEQLNKFSNMECVTIKQKLVFVKVGGKTKYELKPAPLSCELRFKPQKPHCNRLIRQGSLSEDCKHS